MRGVVETCRHTFDFLVLLVTNVSGNLDSITNQGAAESKLDSRFDGGVILNDIDGQSRPFGK